MSTHNICFHGEIRKNFNSFWLKIVPHLELCYIDHIPFNLIIYPRIRFREGVCGVGVVGWLIWSLTAQSTLLRSCQAGQFT